MPIPLDNDTGERVLLYGADGSTPLKVAVDSSGRLVVVGSGSGGAQEVVQDTPADLKTAAHGLDGATQRQVVVDSTGRFVAVPGWDAMSTELLDAALATHTETARWTYTVPDDTFALVEHCFISVSLTTADNDGQNWIEFQNSAGARKGFVIQITSLTARPQFDAASPHLILDAGEKLVCKTVLSDAVTRIFRGSAHIREYTK